MTTRHFLRSAFWIGVYFAVAAAPHPLQGMENCGSCHGPDDVLPYPEDYSGRDDDRCVKCHMLSGNKGGN